MTKTFEVTKEQEDKIHTWIHDVVYPQAIKYQKKQVKNPRWEYISSWEAGYPYEGAIGGGLTYEFTPNSIGVALW